MKGCRSVVYALLLGLVLSNAAIAGSKKKQAPPQVPTIASVTPNSVTIVEGKRARTLTITQFTEINVNGQPAAIVDLKPGMTVSVTIGMDPTRASRVVATGVPAGGSHKKK